MFFADLIGAAGFLEVEQLGFEDMDRRPETFFDLMIKISPQNFINKLIQSLTIPPAIHVRFTQRKRTAAQKSWK